MKIGILMGLILGNLQEEQTAASANEIYVAGGGTLSEVDYNASITNIPSPIFQMQLNT